MNNELKEKAKAASMKTIKRNSHIRLKWMRLYYNASISRKAYLEFLKNREVGINEQRTKRESKGSV